MKRPAEDQDGVSKALRVGPSLIRGFHPVNPDQQRPVGLLQKAVNQLYGIKNMRIQEVIDGVGGAEKYRELVRIVKENPEVAVLGVAVILTLSSEGARDFIGDVYDELDLSFGPLKLKRKRSKRKSRSRKM